MKVADFHSAKTFNRPAWALSSNILIIEPQAIEQALGIIEFNIFLYRS